MLFLYYQAWHFFFKKTIMQGWYYVESLTGQRHDRVQTESQELQPWSAISTLLGLVSTVQQASNEVISWSRAHPCPLYADGDDLRWNSNPNLCRLANATGKTRDKGQQEKSRISSRWSDKENVNRRNCLAEKPRSNHVKSEQHVGSEKTYGPQNAWQSFQFPSKGLSSCWPR